MYIRPFIIALAVFVALAFVMQSIPNTPTAKAYDSTYHLKDIVTEGLAETTWGSTDIASIETLESDPKGGKAVFKYSSQTELSCEILYKWEFSKDISDLDFHDLIRVDLTYELTNGESDCLKAPLEFYASFGYFKRNDKKGSYDDIIVGNIPENALYDYKSKWFGFIKLSEDSPNRTKEFMTRMPRFKPDQYFTVLFSIGLNSDLFPSTAYIFKVN